MKKYINIILIISTILSLFNNVNAANIDLLVSPIKYEIIANPWATITKTAKLINKSNDTMTINTWVSDFIANDSSWNPRFVRKSELVNPNQELASWIDINTSSFNIAAQEEIEVEFTINVPADASPGWHYWAVFFKNYWNDSTNSNWKVKINVDYWVLLLITVDWEIIDDWEPWETNVVFWWWSTTWYNSWNIKIDKCPLWDLTKSNFDWKCIDDFGIKNILDWIIWNNKPKEENNNSAQENPNENDSTEDDSNENETSDFNVTFDIPFKNDWNTHIKPEWKITLIDENWDEIKWVWKEIIENENWITIWEKIVDYIPINDNWWNVLPNTERIFISEWKWFPYESYDESWKKIINFWTPSEYYSNKYIKENTIIYPWQRINENIEKRKIKAMIELAYKNYEWENIEFNSAKEFYVDYKTKNIGLNPYFFILWLLSMWILYIFFFIFKKKSKKKCKYCKKDIKKDMKICPYCWKDQYEKQEEKNNYIYDEIIVTKREVNDEKIEKDNKNPKIEKVEKDDKKHKKEKVEKDDKKHKKEKVEKDDKKHKKEKVEKKEKKK